MPSAVLYLAIALTIVLTDKHVSPYCNPIHRIKPLNARFSFCVRLLLNAVGFVLFLPSVLNSLKGMTLCPRSRSILRPHVSGTTNMSMTIRSTSITRQEPWEDFEKQRTDSRCTSADNGHCLDIENCKIPGQICITVIKSEN